MSKKKKKKQEIRLYFKDGKTDIIECMVMANK